MKHHKLTTLFLALFVCSISYSGELAVSSLNAYFCFSPNYPAGSLKNTPRPETQEEYVRKISNLSTLVNTSSIVGLQEVEKQSVADLATELKFKQAFVKGRDTYTAQDVGILVSPNVTLSSHGRVKELDKLVTKHLLVKAKLSDGTKVNILNVHLIRPIGEAATKHAAQLGVIQTWAETLISQGENVIVMGDFNATGKELLGAQFRDAINEVPSAKTGLFGKALDHIYVSPSITIKTVQIKQPPYGKKPNDLNKRLWTDHFAVTAVVDVK